MGQMVKNLPVMPETWVQSLDQEGPLEKGMTTYSSIYQGKGLARRGQLEEVRGLGDRSVQCLDCGYCFTGVLCLFGETHGNVYIILR